MPALTSRDREILDALTLRIKVLTLHQIARTWWAGSTALQTATRRLQHLENEGLLNRFTAYAHPELQLCEPVFAWSPGEHSPQFGSMSYKLVSRWTAPHRPVEAVIASRKAGIMLGGHGGKLPKRIEQNHDIHLSAVYLHLRKTHPLLDRCWLSEETIRRSRPNAPGEKLPDAIVRINDIEKVVDFGGEYSADKLESFHTWAEKKGLAYEFW